MTNKDETDTERNTIAASVLDLVGSLPESVRSSPTAALVLHLAEQITRVDADKVAPVSKELRAALADLRAEAASAGDQGDIVDGLRDELAERRRTSG